MKVLLFDPFSGASGDMILASLLDLGVDYSKIEDAVASLDINLKMEVKEEEKRGIAAKKVTFVDEKGIESKKSYSYSEMMQKIEDSGLEKEIKKLSLSILEIILKAEERVHRRKKEDLVLHELSSVDTIADLVANSAAFFYFQHQFRDEIKVLSTPISVGGGFISTSHGFLPVPAPATAEIFKNSSLLYKGGPIEEELLTPTGAAILTHFVHYSVSFPPVMRVEKIGYGAGSKDFSLPNVLRTVFGEIPEPEQEELLVKDEVEVLETNVDDVTGEVLGNLVEVLMGEGAKDVAIIPAMMKKGRMGHIIKVITAPQDVHRIAYRLMEETGSLGVKAMQVKHRFIANREKKKVKVRIKGVEKEVKVKIGKDNQGRQLNISAEYEDAKRIAKELKMPVKEVMKIVKEATQQKEGYKSTLEFSILF